MVQSTDCYLYDNIYTDNLRTQKLVQYNAFMSYDTNTLWNQGDHSPGSWSYLTYPQMSAALLPMLHVGLHALTVYTGFPLWLRKKFKDFLRTFKDCRH